MFLGQNGYSEEGDGADSGTSSDALLSLTAHELRTSLSVIKWYTEMLLDGDCGPLQDDQIKYLKTIQTSNQKAIDLIRSILNVSRLNLGTFSITPEETELESVLKHVIIDLKSLAEERGVSIEEYYGDATSHILLDRHLCTIIFRNLISNAILFSKVRGKVEISVKDMKQGEECGGKMLRENSIVAIVSDFGIGIPEEDKQYVFSKPFHKVSNVADTISKGVGLGLYITKLILDKTQGEIWFTSEKDAGSTFYVAFPKSGMHKKEGRTVLD